MATKPPQLLAYAINRFNVTGAVDADDRLDASSWMSLAAGFGRPRHFHQIGCLESQWNTLARNRLDAYGVFQVLPETRGAFNLPGPSPLLWHQLAEASVVFARHYAMVERIKPGCCDVESLEDLAMLLHYPRALTYPSEPESVERRTAYLEALAGYASATDRDLREVHGTDS